MSIYVCGECGSRSRKQTWCPAHPYSVLTEESTMTDNEMQEAFDALHCENEELRQKLADENAANIDSSFSTDILLRDNTNLKEELERLRFSYVSLSTELVELKEELRNAERDRDTYFNRLSAARKALGGM